MTWREAFLRQARIDAELWRCLDETAFSHQLHYFQMVTEKLAKGYLTPATSAKPPSHTHIRLVRFMQQLKTAPASLREKLGFPRADAFRAYLDSLLPIATRIEALAPAVAGDNQPNPEYPWQEPSTGEIIVPGEYSFASITAEKVQYMKLVRLIRSVLAHVK
ncbi:MAG TPA: hypothetical protein VEJ63_16780 [Planctomycetota bacterium]|nr:hypothetical protein [Planctomycetota bacterium]